MTQSAPKVSDDIRNQYLNTIKKVDMDGLKVQVLVTDVRFRYGHIDVLVTPLKGAGHKWIVSDRLEA